MNSINQAEALHTLSSYTLHNQFLRMTIKEVQKHTIIAQAAEKKISEKTATEKLDLSIRQIQRLKQTFRRAGVIGIIHGLRNKSSNYNSPPEKEVLYKSIHEIIKADSRYKGCGSTFTLEQLKKDHKEIFENSNCTVATLRTKMTLWNLWKPGKKRTVGEVHRKWREPKETKGEMIQFDGSYHAWLEGRDGITEDGKPNTCCLLLATDDATGEITKAELTKNEGIECVFPFWKEYSEDVLLGKPYGPVRIK